MKQCPRCLQNTLADEDTLNSMSRRDNKTYICNSCGTKEALIDAGLESVDNNEQRFTETHAK